jgi:large subunit ribosomal protein L24
MSGKIYNGPKLKKLLKRREARRLAAQVKVSLKKGDTVMIISGGNKKKKPLKGKIGKIARIVGTNGDRVIIEGLNMVTRHTRPTAPNKPSGKVQKEAPLHVSNVMFYAEKFKKPVRLKHKVLEDGRKVRGFTNPENKKDFVQIDG